MKKITTSAITLLHKRQLLEIKSFEVMMLVGNTIVISTSGAYYNTLANL